MKNIYIIIPCILLFFTIRLSLNGQIGINTMNPSGVFNIKPDGDKAVDDSKDIIFTKDGLLGLGTDSPKARLHIVSKDKPALRLVDGRQRANRVLTSDAEGNAQWGLMRGTGGQIFNFPYDSIWTYPKGIISDPFYSSGYYHVSINGNYLLFVRLWGKTTGMASASTTTSSTTINFYLRKNESFVDAMQYSIPLGDTSSFFTITVTLGALNCNSGDSIKVFIEPIDGDLILRSNSSYTSKLSIFVM